MAFTRLTLLATLLTVALVQKCQCEDERENSLHLSSRTPYEEVRGTGVTRQAGCTPVALWALVTPGTTYPTAAEIQRFSLIQELRKNILENHNKWNSGELSRELLELLEKWEVPFRAENEGRLTEAGREEVNAFIHRLQAQFPSLLHSSAASRHLIRPTANPGSRDTASTISMALYNRTYVFEEAGDVFQWLESQCPAWTRAKQNAGNRAESFRNSELMSGIVQRISRSLGFNRLNYDLVRDIYRLCTYETVLNLNSTSPWCSLFSQTDLEAFEYEEDLLSYYTGGPGSSHLADNVSCKLFQVLISNLNTFDSAHRVTFQLAHEVSLRAMLTTLGLYNKQQPLTADLDSARSRTWRNSEASPALGNVVTVLNECQTAGTLGVPKKIHTISMFVNERRVESSWCRSLCDFSSFTKGFSSITSTSLFSARKNSARYATYSAFPLILPHVPQREAILVHQCFKYGIHNVVNER